MKPILTLREKLGFLPVLCSIVAASANALLMGSMRKFIPAQSLLLYVKYAVTRNFISRLSIRQLQAISPSTSEVYEKFMDVDGKQSVSLGDGVIGHWIGRLEARNVLIWFHGGGFALPANQGHFQFLAGLREEARKAGIELSIFVPAYTLAPNATYPSQLRQAVSGLRYILNETDHRPAEVVLGGDSAGGNLVFGVLSHLSRPHAHIEHLSLKENLGGAVAIAPWVSLDTKVDHTADDRGDIVSTRVVKPWATGYLGGTTRDHYTDIASAPVDWCRELPVNSILVTAGANELLIGTLCIFATKMKEAFAHFEFCVGENECHVAPIAHLAMGVVAETEQGKRIKSWLIQLLRLASDDIQSAPGGCGK